MFFTRMVSLHHVFLTYCYYFFYLEKPAPCCQC